MKIRDVLKKATEELEKAGTGSAAIDAKVLLAHTLNCDTSALFMKYDEELEEAKGDSFRELIEQRKTNRPVAYITGHREFYSLDFIVNENVLIPRPETEILVEEALKFLEEKQQPLLLDICTGSGNIPITICHEARKRQQDITALAFDISAEALEVAEANKKKHGVENLFFFQLDLFEGIRKNIPKSVARTLFDSAQSDILFDVVTANPPYVPMADKPSIAPDVIDYEPHIALFEDNNGCRAIFRIVEEAEKLLKPGGLLLVEISSTEQSEYIKEWFQSNQWDKSFSSPVFIKDYANINRFLKLEKK